MTCNIVWRLPISRLLGYNETVAIFGHSYQTKLAGYMERTMQIDEKLVEFSFVGEPGLSYEKCLVNAEHFEQLREIWPKYVIVILAGNSVGTNKTRQQINYECSEFYRRLRWYLPKTIIISAQAEMRYYDEANRYLAPTEEQYARDRNAINRHLNTEVPEKDFMMICGGHDLGTACYTGDRIHMSNRGNQEYRRKIINVIKHVHSEIKKRLKVEGALNKMDRRMARRNRRLSDRNNRH